MVILLDIDGVMVLASPWKRPTILEDGFYSFSPKAIASLQKIIAETGASIRITSSHKSNYNIQQWEAIFKSRGIKTSISKLDDNINYQSRKAEILNWFMKNGDENFVIIDDDKALNDLPSSLKKKLVLTSPHIGLTENDALQAIKILKDFRPFLV